MHVWALCVCLLLFSCGPEPTRTAITTQPPDTITAPEIPSAEADKNLSFAINETPEEKLPVVQPIKKPSGIYRFLLPVEEGQKVLHTISFTPGTYRLQEEYGSRRDSVIVTEGTWAPSAGYIWLYRDQVVRGRYTWRGDTLQYYSPRLKQAFSMEKLSPVTVNNVWQTKRKEGVLLYAIGTEPFWSVEVNNEDSIVLTMPDWTEPLRAKLTASDAMKDSTVFTALQDSLYLTVYPLFCSDGMSDFLYTKKVRLSYKGQVYEGCGERLRAAN